LHAGHPLSLTTVRRKPTAPCRAAFWLLAFILAATMLATTLPTRNHASAGSDAFALGMFPQSR
jgi:hypothetical protein